MLWAGILLLASSLSQPCRAATDPASGLEIAPGMEQVKAQCGACHSTRLVTQNRADREGWEKLIRWMQDTQNLWPLGEAEPVILDYLATYYGPRPAGRRAPLNVTFDQKMGSE
ncbi:MAG: hypothetical protein V2J89_10170 [Halieaceae bacterium]|jgi:hypothetical protein|nr:hypothetical protein [Halieaceae bacterium]